MKKKRRVLITGASRGIGRATLCRLHEDGFQLCGISRTAPTTLPANCEYYSCDLDDLEKVRSLVSKLSRDWPFYALINNAASFPVGMITDTTPGQMMATMNMNVCSALVCAQEVLSGMQDLGEGRIVNISSRAALGKISRTAYAASKAALTGMTRTWALELAPSKITVNAVSPGPVDTESFRESLAVDNPKNKGITSSIPLRRMGTPDEIAHSISFLLDHRAAFITGQTLYVDGGLTINASNR